MLLVAAWVVVSAGSSAAHFRAEPTVLPHERVDPELWRATAPDRIVYGGAPRPVYIRARDAEGSAWLRSVGVRASASEFQLVHVDVVALRQLLERGDHVELQRAPAHRLLLDVSVPETRADLVARGEALELARTGKGVLVGIIDTGLDLAHPAFRRSDGSSRVVAVWDQDATSGRAPATFGYGHECRARDLRENQCALDDLDGHGTHVAGIAAGHRSLGGLAPDAELAVVRSRDFTRIADAVAYLDEVAHRRGQPLVVNMSVGGQYGPHDGRTPIEEYLASVATAGRVFVAAAGNDGAERIHVGVALASEPQRIALEGIPWGRSVETYVELWSGATDALAVALELWDGDSLLAEQPLLVTAGELLLGALELPERVVLDFAFGMGWDDTHRLARRTLVLDGSRGSIPSGATLALRVSGVGHVHGWINQSDYRFGAARFGTARAEGWVAGDGQHSVTVPATSPHVIAVGAYAVRTSWSSADGALQTLPALAVGGLARYSSLGPTTAPGFTGTKPDVAAPGSVIISARARVVEDGPSAIDRDRVVMQGTSMAAPHVAGVVALMLEANPELTSVEAKRALVRAARHDDFTGATPNDGWGFGKLDALGAVQSAERSARGCSATSASWLTPWLASLLLLTRASRRRASWRSSRQAST